ncbi:MAG: transglutaminase family protein [Parasphingorhabdus sp.]|uniref:transglutaminase-like domain-containing protein n=1 Tax=Parasphingorhabdus sp. TaxID=2709688 RepID=UPI003001232F
MNIQVEASIAYKLQQPTDLMLQLEVAKIPEQTVMAENLAISPYEHMTRVPAHDMIGERIWLHCEELLDVRYTASVAIADSLPDYRMLEKLPMHLLPGETVQYLNESRYCPSQQFTNFVNSEFGQCRSGDDHGGQMVGKIRDWIHDKFTYASGTSDASTTALDSFVERQGVCRDYAHVLVTLTRAAGIPARVASVYALGVEPQDFHAVGEVFLGGGWHLVDATGMAKEVEMVKIGIGRDAADISFLTAYNPIEMIHQKVEVSVL